MIAGFQFLNTKQREEQKKKMPVCIVCTKCNHNARKLFYQKRENGQKITVSTFLGYCENCDRYEIPEELSK